MTFLVGTHTFLWFITGGSLELSEKAKELIENDNNDVFILPVIWEISIKTAIGKLPLGLMGMQLSTQHKLATKLSSATANLVDFCQPAVLYPTTIHSST